MMLSLHINATTPAIRAKIAASEEPESVLAGLYGVTINRRCHSRAFPFASCDALRRGGPSAIVKNTIALSAGEDIGTENWAMLASLVVTCDMADLNAVDYIAATLRAILDGHPQRRIADPLP